ncbi:hypothetical protein EMIT091MI3_20182 [Kosakonia quasisacchari]
MYLYYFIELSGGTMSDVNVIHKEKGDFFILQSDGKYLICMI